jgi:hypothetical protein
MAEITDLQTSPVKPFLGGASYERYDWCRAVFISSAHCMDALQSIGHYGAKQGE